MDVSSSMAADAAPSGLPDDALPSVPAHDTPHDIGRCPYADRRRLLEEFILADRPVVIPDLAAAWPALRRWTPEFFRTHYGTLSCEIDGRRWHMAEYLDRAERSTPDDPAPYPFNFDMLAQLPALIADVQPQPRFGRIDRLRHPLMWRTLLKGTRPHELFFGGGGSVFRRLHVDTLYLHGHITQIRGDKEFFLYPPEQTPLMYPALDNPKLSRIVDPLHPDLARFPRFAEARPWHTRLREGETIFFPSGWWHFTQMHGPCISYGGIGLTASNWPAFIADNLAHRRADGVPRWKLGALRAYGTVAGAAMRAHEVLVARR